MNIKKLIAAVLCLSVLANKPACGYDIIGQNQTEVTLMASASEAKEVIKILPAAVNSEYKQVLVDGSTTNMDAGTVYRGLGVITGNNSSRLLMDYKAKNPKAYWEIMKGDWYRTVPDQYVHFNRTISRATVAKGEKAKTMQFSFTGSRFSLIGQSDAYKIKVYVDGKLLKTCSSKGTKARQCSAWFKVPEGEHTVKIVVVSGTFTIDAIEY